MRHELVSDTICFYYGLIAACTSLLHNIFIVHHIDAFLTVFGISKSAFWIGELVFLIWNSLNDPLFGWLTDRHLFNNKNVNTVAYRSCIISLTAPAFAIAFLFTWNPCMLQHLPGIRFALVICFYDSALTMLVLQHDALLADLAITSKDRIRLGTAATFGQALAASGIMIVTPWREGYPAAAGILPFTFRCLCTLMAVLSCLGLWVGATMIAKCFPYRKGFTEKVDWEGHLCKDNL
ncbi:unnamed protein product [Protopolystoma xenopodis]|uniref:Major facilitator superfamily associated domain-containing protein n=1 Tax=Protopolystoma xenopodis TaxID=117903 RepID=A0A448WJH7_9PLAT|nr:unnamed protein product [Protopolystoma xenopodis]